VHSDRNARRKAREKERRRKCAAHAEQQKAEREQSRHDEALAREEKARADAERARAQAAERDRIWREAHAEEIEAQRIADATMLEAALQRQQAVMEQRKAAYHGARALARAQLDLLAFLDDRYEALRAEASARGEDPDEVEARTASPATPVRRRRKVLTVNGRGGSVMAMLIAMAVGPSEADDIDLDNGTVTFGGRRVRF
jgi:hypothetical protein